MPENTPTPTALNPTQYIPNIPAGNGAGQFPVDGQMVIYKESKKIWFIRSVSDGRVYYWRPLGDAHNLSEEEFSEKFRPATLQEAEGFVALANISPDKLLKRGGIKVSDLPGSEEPVGTLIEPGENDTFEFLVVHQETKDSILAGVKSIEKRFDIDARFGIGKISPIEGKCILVFHGKSGTGKTHAAKAVCKLLGKPLYLVDYASVISKYVGDTAKNIAAAFRQAKHHDAVLMFDEADSLFSKRVDMSGDDGGMQAFATSVNQNRNVLMQEMDKHDGVVIGTTNFFRNFDAAILRRINRGIEFNMPDAAMRTEILKHHFPVQTYLKDIDFKELGAITNDFAGGDLLNVAANSMNNAAAKSDNVEEWFITMEDIKAAITDIEAQKTEHGIKKKKGTMGFSIPDKATAKS